MNLIVAAQGQYAFSQLLASEEFGFGGSNYGRAFDPSEFSGDHGAAGKLELQYVGNAAFPFARVVYYGFFDYGTVWRIDDSSREARDSASSAGLGIRYALADRVDGYVELGKPLLNRVAARGNDGEDVRLFFSISARF